MSTSKYDSTGAMASAFFGTSAPKAVEAVFGESKPKRHDHRQSFWVIGSHLWCYRCGAVRFTIEASGESRWIKPTGPQGENPAMKK